MAMGSELPRFIVCPSCGTRYDDNRKRRVIDSCGHPKCILCLFKDEKTCSLCEKSKNSSNIQQQTKKSREIDKSLEIEWPPQQNRIQRARSITTSMMGRSVSLSSGIDTGQKRGKAASFSRADRMNDFLSYRNYLKGTSTDNVSCQQDSDVSKVASSMQDTAIAASDAEEAEEASSDAKIKIDILAKKIDRKASFSSVLSRNSQSFKNSAFRRSGSFSRAIEYEKWNEVSFLPTMSEIENEGSAMSPRQLKSAERGTLVRRKSVENVLKRATSWLEESKSTFNNTNRLFGATNNTIGVTCNDQVDGEDCSENNCNADDDSRAGFDALYDATLDTTPKPALVAASTALADTIPNAAKDATPNAAIDASSDEVLVKTSDVALDAANEVVAESVEHFQDNSSNADNKLPHDSINTDEVQASLQNTRELSHDSTPITDAKDEASIVLQAVNCTEMPVDNASLSDDCEYVSSTSSSESESHSDSHSDVSLSSFDWLLNDDDYDDYDGSDVDVIDKNLSKNQFNSNNNDDNYDGNDKEDGSYLPAIRQLLYGQLEKDKAKRKTVLVSPRKNANCQHPFTASSPSSKQHGGNNEYEPEADVIEQADATFAENDSQCCKIGDNSEACYIHATMDDCSKHFVTKHLASDRHSCEEEATLSFAQRNVVNNSRSLDGRKLNSGTRREAVEANDSRLGNECDVISKSLLLRSNADVANKKSKVRTTSSTEKTDQLLQPTQQQAEEDNSIDVYVEANSRSNNDNAVDVVELNDSSKRSFRKPGCFKDSWSTSDADIRYLPSLKKTKKQRPNSFNRDLCIEWNSQLIPKETDVDFFCEGICEGEEVKDAMISSSATALLSGSHDDAITPLEDDVFELKDASEKFVAVEGNAEDDTGNANNIILETEESKTMTGRPHYDNIDVRRDDNSDIISSMSDRERDGNMLRNDSTDLNRKTLANNDICGDNQILLNSKYKISEGLVIKSNMLENEEQRLKEEPAINMGDTGDKKASCSNDELQRNKTDDWKTANSHIWNKNKRSGGAGKRQGTIHESLLHLPRDSSVPVVYVAENDLKLQAIGKTGCNGKQWTTKERKPKTITPLASKAASKGKHRAVDSKYVKHGTVDKSKGPPHGIRFIRNKIQKWTRWSKKSHCLVNEASVNLNDKPIVNENMLKKHATNESIATHGKVHTTIACAGCSVGSDVSTEYMFRQIASSKEGSVCDAAAPQGSCHGPLLIGHKSTTDDHVTDEASLTSVSTLIHNPPHSKLGFENYSDESSIVSSDSFDSMISSRLSMLDDSSVDSSETISTSVRDNEMPEFRSPSRIQQDLTTLLEKKVTRRRQGLNEIDFHSMMPSSKDCKSSMVSREWLYDIVYELLLARKEPSQTNKHEARGLIICAGNGCGKTSSLRSMIWNDGKTADRFGSGKIRDRITNSVLCYHFCFNTDARTTSVPKFILNMAASLVDNDDFSSYTKAVFESSEICEHLNSGSVERDPETAFREGILKPLNNIFNENASNNASISNQYLFIIDVNEHRCVSCKASECIASLIATNIDLIPKRMKLVVAGTKQSVQALQDTSKLHEVSLDNIKNWDVQRDLYNFTENSITMQQRRASTTTTVMMMMMTDLTKPRARKLIDNVVKFSQGSFDVASMAINYVAHCSVSNTAGNATKHQKFPTLLSMDMHRLFQQIMKLNFGSTERERILAVSLFDILCVAQEPFTLSTLFKVVENGCSSQPVTYHEFECCVEKLLALRMISESMEGRFSVTELTRNCLAVYRDGLSSPNNRKGHNLLSLYYMKTLSSHSGKDMYRLAYHLASSSFGDEIEDEESRVSFLAWTFTQVFKTSTSGFIQPENIFHPRINVYHLFLHTDIDVKIFERTYGKDPLAIASMLGQTHIVHLLLNHNQYSKELFDSSLKEAIKNGATEIVDLLLHHKSDDQSTHDASYLNTALESRQLSIAMSLLKRDWPLDQHHIQKEAAQKTLCEACKVGDLEVITELLQSPDLIIDVGAEDEHGLLPMVCAVGCRQIEIVKILIKSGASVNVSDSEGMSPLLKAVMINDCEMLDMIIEEDADMDAEDRNGRTGLMIAAIQNRCNLIETLFMEGACLGHRDQKGLSALSLACTNGSTKAVRLLLRNRAPVDQTDNMNRTPLHHACVNGSTEIVKLLLDHGADVNHKSDDAVRPIERALHAANYKVVNILLKNSALVRKSCWSIAEKDLEGFLCLIEYFERRGNSKMKDGKFVEANSYFQRALNKIASSQFQKNKKVQRINILCQQNLRKKFLS
eukprot:gene3520-4021_t